MRKRSKDTRLVLGDLARRVKNDSGGGWSVGSGICYNSGRWRTETTGQTVTRGVDVSRRYAVDATFPRIRAGPQIRCGESYGSRNLLDRATTIPESFPE